MDTVNQRILYTVVETLRENAQVTKDLVREEISKAKQELKDSIERELEVMNVSVIPKIDRLIEKKANELKKDMERYMTDSLSSVIKDVMDEVSRAKSHSVDVLEPDISKSE